MSVGVSVGVWLGVKVGVYVAGHGVVRTFTLSPPMPSLGVGVGIGVHVGTRAAEIGLPGLDQIFYAARPAIVPILADVAGHLEISRDELLRRLGL